MNHYTATYSPEDNKLRMYALSRLDAETFEVVKNAGFRWAPKQGFFVAPMWTPQREDLLIRLCDEIGDEDSTLAGRAEERADRFTDYSANRASDAAAARKRIDSISEHIPFGQPILVGHHSERHARKDAERIENSMRKAVKMWDASEYWESRAKGAILHAKYKELPAVRHRRIKGLEADKRKHERTINESEMALKLWSTENLTREQAVNIANHHGYFSRCFSLIDFPRNPPASQYEGSMGLWSALTGDVINEHQAKEIAIKSLQRTIAWAQRWAAHYTNRISYERAMLQEQGGLKAEGFDIQVGGSVLVRNEWVTVLRVNKSAGAINSVTTNARYVSVRSIEEVKDYRPPSEEEAAKVQAVKKLPPLVNFPSEGSIEMTSAEWKSRHADSKGVRLAPATATHGAYRYRRSFVPGGSFTLASVYITDAKRVDPPAPTPPKPEHKETSGQPVPVRVERIAATKSTPAKANDSEAFEAMRERLKAGLQIEVVPQLFPTPDDLADRMVELADIGPQDVIIEPSAGTGAILRAIKKAEEGAKVTAVEINRALFERLNTTYEGINCHHGDFLEFTHFEGVTRILMNPPFSSGQDIQHIQHALGMLTNGGRLVAICANGPRQNAQLRPIVEQYGGTWEVLPSDTFKEAGTSVNTVLMALTV